MKQLTQNIRSGKSAIQDVPAPQVGRGSVLIQVAASLVSAGTERMVVEFAEKTMLDKARSRPDLVKQTFDKARRDGVLTTIEAVQNRLDAPMALGYSVAGTVIAVGDGVAGFSPGDRVAAAGAGQAVHAEVVSVARNLVVPIPDALSFESAAFTTLGAIALQGVRLAGPKLGEIIGVIGLGLLGQITVQLLKASGCRVAGFDLQPDRAALAERLGDMTTASSEQQFRSTCLELSRGRGLDAVLITADTKSNGPITLAGEIARDKGIVVAVGAVGLDLPRKPYYEKELDFRISRSYGPGRYDETYEKQGIDYPYAYVRWTENRNMEAFVHVAGTGVIDIDSLITHRIPIDDGTRAYEVITGKTGEPFLGVVLTYPDRTPHDTIVRISAPPSAHQPQKAKARIGFLGAGNFAKAVLLPAVKATGAELVGIATAGGLSSRHAADRFGFQYCATDSQRIFDDESVNAIVIATRHDLHAGQAIRALDSGRHVFVEKPLCLTEDELAGVIAAYGRSGGRSLLMSGFNRRFAPMAVELRKFFSDVREPLLIHYRVNGGFIPATEWVQTAEGGGRLVGEGVHFIDFAIWLAASSPASVHAVAAPNVGRYSDDNFSVVISFESGSVFQLLFVASGDRSMGKERIEVHGRGKSAVLEDFRRLELSSGGRRKIERAILRSDKGHRAAMMAFVEAVANGTASPIEFTDLVTTMRATFAARKSMVLQRPVLLTGES